MGVIRQIDAEQTEAPVGAYCIKLGAQMVPPGSCTGSLSTNKMAQTKWRLRSPKAQEAPDNRVGRCALDARDPSLAWLSPFLALCAPAGLIGFGWAWRTTIRE